MIVACPHPTPRFPDRRPQSKPAFGMLVSVERDLCGNEPVSAALFSHGRAALAFLLGRPGRPGPAAFWPVPRSYRQLVAAPLLAGGAGKVRA